MPHPPSAFSWLVVVITLVLLESASSAWDSLQSVRESVRESVTRLPDTDDEEPPPKPKSKSKSENPSFFNSPSSNSSTTDSSSSDSLGALILGGVLGVVTTPYWAPYIFLDPGFDTPGYFSSYPHQYQTGYQLMNPAEAIGGEGPMKPHWLALRTSVEYGTNFDDQDWFGGRLLVESNWRLGIEADVRQYLDHRPYAPNDSLWLGDVNVFFRFAQNQQLQFRSGLGMNYLSDNIGTETGFNFSYAVDWYPVKPLVSSTEFDLGWLGDSGLAHVRTTLGANWRHAEVFIGWDYYDLSGSQLTGLVSGLRLWW